MEAKTVCKWFALCENPATVTIPHPILGDVPACERCNSKNEKLTEYSALKPKGLSK